MNASRSITIIGGGLAGAEAAWRLLREGLAVRLHEMRPGANTPAHRTDLLAELVCSNSLKSLALTGASGVLNEELRRLGSICRQVGGETAVPAGAALAVDRTLFAQAITRRLVEHPGFTLARGEVTDLPEGPAVIATGPLTSEPLARRLLDLAGAEAGFFYDAIAPTIEIDTADTSIWWRATRRNRGTPDYWNIPLDREAYERFFAALVEADQHAGHDWDDASYFEGCMPVEEVARHGAETLRHRAFRPVGLDDPRTGRYPHAVVQLRQDNAEGTLWSLVGCQTRLTYGDQKRVWSLLPGLENATFARLGAMHRNFYLKSPRLLNPDLSFKERPDLFLAGQITGVEGYMESAGCGLMAGLNLARRMQGRPPALLPPTTVLGALMHYVTTADVENFQPMNANFGLLPHMAIRGKTHRYKAYAERALADVDQFISSLS